MAIETPPTRPCATSKPKRGRLRLGHVVLGAAVLVGLAAYIGNRGERPAQPSAAGTDATEVDTAPRVRVALIQGEKARSLAAVDDATMTVFDGGQAVRIEGGVGRRFAEDLRRILEANPSLQRIDVTSGGGYTITGFEAARMINRRNLIVRVKGHCASICVALWAAAAQRQMEPDALIGLHQWNPQCDVMPADLQSQCRRQAEVATDHIFTYEAWLRSAGFDRELLQLQARTPAKDIAVLTTLQLWEHGVDFRAVDAQGQPMNRTQVRNYLVARAARG